jgi:hypothetical protein
MTNKMIDKLRKLWCTVFGHNWFRPDGTYYKYCLRCGKQQIVLD